MVGVDLVPVLDLNLPHHVAHVDQRGVPEFFLRENTAAFEVVFIELGEGLIDTETAVGLEEAEHLGDSHSLVGRVRRDLVEEDVVDVNKEFALQLKLLAVFEVVVLELLLLVGLGRPADLGVAVLGVRLLLPFLSHIIISADQPSGGPVAKRATPGPISSSV